MKFIMIWNQDLQKLADDINLWLSAGKYTVKNSQLIAVPESDSNIFIMSIFYEEL